MRMRHTSILSLVTLLRPSLIDPKEIDDLKLEAKHTIDMVRFVDEDEIDTRYWEKPYYLVPDGYEAEEGYAIMQRALTATRKVAIGQLIMGGRAHPGLETNGAARKKLLTQAIRAADTRKCYFLELVLLAAALALL